MNKPPIERQLAPYCNRLKTERANEIYVKILEHLVKGKRYRDQSYSTKQLAADLKTNTRYISAAIVICTRNNYSALVNSLRLRDACKMLCSPRYAKMSAEEIGLLSGYSSRQAFYLAFGRMYDCTPKEYRKKYTPVAEPKQEKESSASSF